MGTEPTTTPLPVSFFYSRLLADVIKFERKNISIILGQSPLRTDTYTEKENNLPIPANGSYFTMIKIVPR